MQEKLVPALVVLLLVPSGCRSSDAKDADGSGGAYPAYDGGPPPSSGPVHFAIEGLVDLQLPADPFTALIRYWAVNPEISADIVVNSPQPRPSYAGLSLSYSTNSGTATLTESNLWGADVRYHSQHDALLVSEGHIAPEGVDVRGTVELEGATRAVVLEGPLYRVCVRYGTAPDVGGGWSEAGGAPYGIGTPTAEPEVYDDPTFSAPECEPFR